MSECRCGGREFGVHSVDCPVKNGVYTQRFERKGTSWPIVATVAALVALYCYALYLI